MEEEEKQEKKGTNPYLCKQIENAQEMEPGNRYSIIKDSRKFYLDIGLIRCKSRNNELNSQRAKT